jgi:hypothetical protein
MQRKSLIAALAVAAVAVATAGTQAEAAIPQGWVPVIQCTSLSGTAQYTPGLKYAAHANHEIVTGTLAGCSDSAGPIAGVGTFSAVLSSPAATRNVNNESGTFVINWPAAAGLNPTTGNVNTMGPNASQYTVNGTDTGGAYLGAPMSTAWLVTSQTLGGKKGNAVVSESFVNTLPLQIKENFG